MSDRGSMVLGEKRRRHPLGKVGRRIRWIVIAIVVAGCVSWSLGSVDEKTRIRQALVDISRISHATRLFRADFGRCPAGVEELTDPPEGASYMGVIKDPWGRSYRLTCPARLDPGGVDVVSGGPDGETTGDDNISSL